MLKASDLDPVSFLCRPNVFFFAFQPRQEIEKERVDPFFPSDSDTEVEDSQGVLATTDADDDVGRVGKDCSQDGE